MNVTKHIFLQLITAAEQGIALDSIPVPQEERPKGIRDLVIYIVENEMPQDPRVLL